jgi:hypothetical protein
MPTFAELAIMSVRLAQEEVATTTTDPTTVPTDVPPPPEGGPLPSSITPTILYSWLGANLALGYAGWKAYDYNIYGNADLAYEFLRALVEALGGTFSREDFDATYFSDEFYKNPNVIGFSRSRLAGFISAALSIAGTAVTVRSPSNFFQFVFGTTFFSVYVLAQAFLAKGWYDGFIDPTDPATDTVEEVDPFFVDSRNYLFSGGLVAFAADIFILTKFFLLKPPDAPPSESGPEPLPPTDTSVELSIW